MPKKIFSILMALVMIAGVSSAGYFWNETQKRDSIIASLTEEIHVAEKRMRAIHRKYAEEKAKLGTCVRMKMVEESNKLKFQKQVKELIAEKDVILSQKEAIEKKYQASLAAQETKEKWVESYKEKIAKLEDRYTQLQKKYQASEEENRQKTGDIRQLQAEKKDIEFELKQTEKSLERSNKHNERLCVLSEELVEKYWGKKRNVADPFTKIGLVELEHLVQEYLKKIDKEKVIMQ